MRPWAPIDATRSATLVPPVLRALWGEIRRADRAMGWMFMVSSGWSGGSGGFTLAIDSGGKELQVLDALSE